MRNCRRIFLTDQSKSYLWPRSVLMQPLCIIFHGLSYVLSFFFPLKQINNSVIVFYLVLGVCVLVSSLKMIEMLYFSCCEA